MDNEALGEWRVVLEIIGVLTAFMVAAGGFANFISFMRSWRSHSIARHLKSLEAAALAVDIEEKLHNRGVPRTDLTNIRFILEDFNISTGMLREENLETAPNVPEREISEPLISEADIQNVVSSFVAHMKKTSYLRYFLCPRSYGVIAIITKIFFQAFRVAAAVWTLPLLLMLLVVSENSSDPDAWAIFFIVLLFQVAYLGLMMLFRYATMQNTIGRIRKLSFRHYLQLRSVYLSGAAALPKGRESEPMPQAAAASAGHG